MAERVDKLVDHHESGTFSFGDQNEIYWDSSDGVRGVQPVGLQHGESIAPGVTRALEMGPHESTVDPLETLSIPDSSASNQVPSSSGKLPLYSRDF